MLGHQGDEGENVAGGGREQGKNLGSVGTYVPKQDPAVLISSPLCERPGLGEGSQLPPT